MCSHNSRPRNNIYDTIFKCISASLISVSPARRDRALSHKQCAYNNYRDSYYTQIIIPPAQAIRVPLAKPCTGSRTKRNMVPKSPAFSSRPAAARGGPHPRRL